MFDAIHLWHATSTGKNCENIINFMKGARSDAVMHSTQGKGFYGFLKFEHALNHIKFLKGEVETFGEQDRLPILGAPMIVRLTVRPNPKFFDIDYEVCGRLALKFLYDNFENVLKKIPDGKIKRYDNSDSTLKPSRMRKTPLSDCMGFWFETPGGYKSSHGFCWGPMAEIDRDTADLISNIFDYIKEHMPLDMLRFELEVLQVGDAIKYVGKAPLPVTEFLVELDGKWEVGDPWNKKKFEIIKERINNIK